MKKLFSLLLAALLGMSTTFAQKDQLVAKITEKHDWVYAYAIEKTATLNLSENMWAQVLGEERNPKGYTTFKRMGKAFCDLSDKFGGSTLEKSCGFNVRSDDKAENKPTCKSTIDGWGNKYAITVNATSIAGTREGFKMVTGYVSSVAIFLEDGAGSLWHHGYTPPSETIHIIINADDKYKAVNVSWNKERTTVTINAPGTIETAGWDSNIEKGLQNGWIKK